MSIIIPQLGNPQTQQQGVQPFLYCPYNPSQKVTIELWMTSNNPKPLTIDDLNLEQLDTESIVGRVNTYFEK